MISDGATAVEWEHEAGNCGVSLRWGRAVSRLSAASVLPFPGDYLGGEAYWAGGLHLYTPLPFRPGQGGFGELFRTHFFLNAGNLCNLDYGKTQLNVRAGRVCGFRV